MGQQHWSLTPLRERETAVEAKGIVFSRDSEPQQQAALLWGQVTKYTSHLEFGDGHGQYSLGGKLAGG